MMDEISIKQVIITDILKKSVFLNVCFNCTTSVAINSCFVRTTAKLDALNDLYKEKDVTIIRLIANAVKLSRCGEMEGQNVAG